MTTIIADSVSIQVTEQMVTDSQSITIGTVKTFKRQPGLGKLNRLTKSAQNTLFANGHSNNRFKRDYVAGTANYTCANCQATVVATASTTRGASSVSGEALVTKCTKSVE